MIFSMVFVLQISTSYQALIEVVNSQDGKVDQITKRYCYATNFRGLLQPRDALLTNIVRTTGNRAV